MKISYNWLKQYIDALPEPEKLSLMLTDCGLEVESLEHFQSIKGGLKGVFVGRVEECVKHPNADKLSLTKVNVGSGELLSIVCGAPNVAAGQMVLVATIGTKVTTSKGEFTIEKTKIRGEVSEGMICAEDELGLGTSHAGIMVLPEDTKIGLPAAEYFNIEEDFSYEIGLTPNRSDATSHLGVARDIIALINFENFKENKPQIAIQLPSVANFKVDSHDINIPVIVEDEAACPRYSGLTISGVKVEESPKWLQDKLKAIDLRPINNIVDITNYVLFETGQPLHAFDADKITGQKVIVRKLPKGTRFITLDGVDRELTGHDLMICNEKEGMCIAGVFGGEKSGVTEQTVNIFLESACFDPATIRKTSKHHDLKTDASFRFERGSDINVTVYALKRAAILIQEIAGGKISSDIMDVCPGSTERNKVAISFSRLDSLAGKHIEPEIVKNILQSLEVEITKDNPDGLELLIPTSKVDVTREVDVFEEVLRIYGFNNIEIPDFLRSNLSYRPQPDREAYRTAISEMLTANGFNEIMTNSLSSSAYAEKFANAIIPEKDVKIFNPLSRELNVMRQSLLFTGLEVLVYNQNRKNQDLMLYEFGNVYRFDGKIPDKGLKQYAEKMQLALFMMGFSSPESWRKKQEKTDFFIMKSFAEKVFSRLGIERKSLKLKTEGNLLLNDQLHFYQNDTLLCTIGSIAGNVLKHFDLRDEVQFASFEWDVIIDLAFTQKVKYQEVPKFPAVRRDLALLIEESVSWDQIEKLAYETESNLLKDVSLFDIYTDEKMGGKKSYAVSFLIQDMEKTFTDKEIEAIMEKLINAFSKKLGASLR